MANGFRKLQERLALEGWFVGWNLPCCQSCAWSDVPYDLPDGSKTDLSKVLFNHSQDCEVGHDYEDCSQCMGDGIVENPDYDTEQLAEEHDDDLDEFIDCPTCDGLGAIKILTEEGVFDDSVYGFICHTPEQQSGSLFCFDGDKSGVRNLKEILPIIEECGCSWDWDKTGKTRIYISWE